MRKNQCISTIKQSLHAAPEKLTVSILFKGPLFMHVFLKAQLYGKLREGREFGMSHFKRRLQCIRKRGCKP